MSLIVQFAIGLIFGLGLVVAGMSDPAKVLNFLDVAAIPVGTWDASLALVMASAVTVTFVGFRWLRRRQAPLFARQFRFPPDRRLSRHMVIGPLLFGVGWGMVGLCPGPALTALAFGGTAAWLFAAAMVVGMAAARWFPGPGTGRAAPQSETAGAPAR